MKKTEMDPSRWNDETISNQEFQSLQSDNLVVNGAEFQGCLFKSCSFIESAFIDCKFEDCQFQNCDFSLVRLDRSSFINAVFSHSKCVGINWRKVSIPFSLDVKFCDCNISHSNFLGLNLHHIQIRDCFAGEVNFEEANLTQAIFFGTDLQKARFHNCDLTKADFSSAKNYAIDYKYNKLKKAVFSFPEAMALLAGLDVVLKDG